MNLSSRLISKLSYANVVATLALFIALGGASYAAVQLPSNSVGSAQIKNGAVSTQKLSPRVQAALKNVGARGAMGPIGPEGPKGSQGVAGLNGDNGTDGENGATGAAGSPGATGPTGLLGSPGPTGATGERGPSELFALNTPNGDVTLADNQTTTLHTLTLQPGSYLASSMGHISNTLSPRLTKRRTECFLMLDGTYLTDTSAFNGAFDVNDVNGSAGVIEAIAMQNAFTITTPSTLTAKCFPHNGPTAASLTLTALKVGSIN